MRRLLVVLCVVLAVKNVFAVQYRTQIFDENIRTLQVLPNNEQLKLPFIELNSGDEIDVLFDELTYEVSNFYYKIVHCDAYWNESDLASMEYLDGFDGGLIDTYDYSVNTTVNYIHYKVTFPNDDVGLKLSGNYAVQIARDGDFEHGVVATACFSVVEPMVDINIEVDGKTMKELNGRYQSVALDVTVDGVGARDMMQDFIVVVRQNGRLDNESYLTRPTYVNGNKLSYENKDELIFEGGNQYRSIDFSSRYTYGAGIDHIEFDQDMYHVVLEADASRASNQEAYAMDAHGGYVINLQKNDYSDTEADYMWVHFYYPAETPYLEGRMYILGDLTCNLVNSDSEMIYDLSERCYVRSLLLKQGGYNYVYALKAKNRDELSVMQTEGSFWQSRNRYDVIVYYRPFGARYDRLVGMRSVE
ncbi:MAG: DUF5103 domain-containing protein [Paludibacteraceae bacterium]|nr:DUF5103 domain-containing protein [Paludibacteraceae bacterium]